ncbi:MAG: 3-hydroxyacyl-CoA dehydrogenase NAD-binding domain-containing protein [Lewinella sp.]|jgi:3-hydroxyacyl-CoA dehydrogenase/enoyl-CoA hydratase/3-hydroxybutyryl-CoA epimerase|uniref:3-hydroxyacyl-CoA dehydrogenase NAD-binding domain-containing protein n=1 Tax=Lewinella sp. TaxID=2004506 RepID=UPI003D6C2928
MIRLKKDTANIVTIIFDMEDREDNVINHEITDAFLPVIKRLQEEKAKGQLKGVILTSNKKSFLSGGDLGYLYGANDPEELFQEAEKLSRFFRDLERPGVPVVAAIAGNALGSGFEVALACHHRIVLDDPRVRVGIPEVNLGLMPSGGSIVRMMWLLGIEKAYPVLTSGRHYSPQEALKVGIVDDLASTKKELIEKARAWLLSHPYWYRPWDQEGETIPGGTAKDPALIERVRATAAELAAATYNNSPAKRTILNVLVEGSKVDFPTACRIENRRFAHLVCSSTAKNMISTFWMDYHSIKKGISRPKGYGKFRVRKVGIIGSGRMGSGITLSCIQNGLSVVLKDVSKAIAERGREYVSQRIDELIREGTFHPTEKKEIMERLVTTEKAADFADCDIVIEAVFENQHLKQKVTREAEEQLDNYSIIGTNTVSIPIAELGKALRRPQNYVGLHFFPPAESVPLVEIVAGADTSDETVARAIDFVQRIIKIPIVVKDVWGFYAARVQNTYILEGISMLKEGYPPALIENSGRQLGLPNGPLELADAMGLQLVLKYEEQAAMHYGSNYVQHPAVSVLKTMIEDLERTGRTKKAGFYEYDQEGNKILWNGLHEHWAPSKTSYDRKRLNERLLFAQVIEALWCMQEGVITSAAAANLGSVYGWGFPKETGGVIRFVQNYGVDNFMAQAKVYHKDYGQRFRLPKVLKNMITEPNFQLAKAAVE